MEAFKNIGLIEFGVPEKRFRLGSVSSLKGYKLRKVLLPEGHSAQSARSQYPQAEIVQDKREIIQDEDIDLVIVSAPSRTDLPLVGEVLRAGKNVRIV
ncbi:MAG: Gfo/Idh/MocA family oxidoreductase [Puia sp.]|nr:Gfo/Idh/MocA family oxidoreductase [Puia sp.]